MRVLQPFLPQSSAVPVLWLHHFRHYNQSFYLLTYWYWHWPLTWRPRSDPLPVSPHATIVRSQYRWTAGTFCRCQDVAKILSCRTRRDAESTATADSSWVALHRSSSDTSQPITQRRFDHISKANFKQTTLYNEIYRLNVICGISAYTKVMTS